MRMMPPAGALMRTGALAAALALPAALCAQQRDPYAATLQFGTGLINIPTAWVSPSTGDVWLQTSGKVIEHFVDPSAMNFATKWNSNLSIDTHWLGRFSVGFSAYSQNPEWGFFGQALLLKPGQLGFNGPSVAVGFRNLGDFDHEDRLLVGHDVHLNPTDSTYDDEVGVFAGGFSTAPTFYGVATQEFGGSAWSGSLTLGYGNGLFKDDGNLGDDYNLKGQIAAGLFFGARAVFHPTLNTSISVLGENDGWDWNAGLVGDWRGISLGVYGTELEAGSRDPTKCTVQALCRVYNYAKLNLSLGYSGNIIDIANGVLLRNRITMLEREQQRLRSEINSRERRITSLETTLRRAQAGELAEISNRRQELEKQIQEERDAIRKATERLEQLERQRQPPPPPPPANPPAGSGTTPPTL
jgi:hypothetical protein